MVALPLLFLLCFFVGGAPEPIEDRLALLSFLNKTPYLYRLQWNSSASTCDWRGVSCNADRTHVISLRLPGKGLNGPVPPNSISRISTLRILSLRGNRLSGTIPPDFGNLISLRALHLQGNIFSGEIPPQLSKLSRLIRLDLSVNRLSGEIPIFLNDLRNLRGLFLQKNNLSGALTGLKIPSVTRLNVSYNTLSGSIPRDLARFPSSSFAGNLGLCGTPLSTCDSKKKIPTKMIIVITVACGAVLLLLLLLLLIFLLRRRRIPAKEKKAEGSRQRSSDAEESKLVIFNNGTCDFGLEDLLRASAEVLGKGSLGTTYKAVLEDGATVVVKRLKEVTVGKKEFETLVSGFGAVRHPNVVPLSAFYFSKDEKLLLSDYISAGSLSSLLHGKSLDLFLTFSLFGPVTSRLPFPIQHSLN